MATTFRPLSLGELLDRTFQLYRNHFLLFVGIAAVSYLPRFVVSEVLLILTRGSGTATTRAGLTLFGTFVGVILALVAVAACQASTVTAVSVVYLGQKITVWGSYSRILGLIPRVILVMIGLGIGIGIGLILLVVPGIILALMWALTIPVVVLENADLREALSRSSELTKGHRGRVFMIYLLFMILTYVTFFVLESPVIALVATKGPRAVVGAGVATLTSALSLIAECLVTPLMTIAISLMYYDERVRKEAFDIHFMMSSPQEITQLRTSVIS